MWGSFQALALISEGLPSPLAGDFTIVLRQALALKAICGDPSRISACSKEALSEKGGCGKTKP
jgi:hypothetical protein